MIVFPLRRSVRLKAATALSRAAMLPMFVRSRPSRTRWMISLSWARSDTRTKSIARTQFSVVSLELHILYARNAYEIGRHPFREFGKSAVYLLASAKSLFLLMI